MNREDLAGFFRLIDNYSPGFASKDRLRGLTEVWPIQVHEIPVEIATAAVHAHYATETRWIMPADVRRYAAAKAGILPPDAATAQAQAVALNNWYGPVGSQPRGEYPDIHPAVLAAIRAAGGVDTAANLRPYDWRAAYEPQAKAWETGALHPGGITAARGAIDAGRPQPRPELEPAGPPEPRRHLRMVGDTPRLDEAIAELGEDARFLLPRGMSLGSRLARSALLGRLNGFGWATRPDRALREARQEIARHSTSQSAADFEANRAAQLRALEAFMEAGNG